ncbi:MAG: baseplate J/gp47 family protein [Oscillospiraceae bacterium]|nr:baseplate J/gp47 family protein [Oscillospiraceae bacterium]
MKTIDEIYMEMQTDFTARTGMEIAENSDISARLYAAAAQIYALYVQADWVNRQCFPQTAAGEYLDHHAQLRALERKQAEYAKGVVRFYGDGTGECERTVPAGTVCMTPGYVRFTTLQEAVLPAGEPYVDVPVQAVQAGAAGNVNAGSVTMLAVTPVGITGCSNPVAMTQGVDAESDEALRKRILDSFARLPNGANCAYYEQVALGFDQVAAAVAIPRKRGIGTVDVVVATHAGVPEQELLEAVAKQTEQCREIAVDVAVVGPETVPVDVTVRIAAQDFDVAAERVKRAVRDYFSGYLLGQGVLRAKLGNLIYGIDGIENYELTKPGEDVAAARGQLPVLGTLTVEEMA